MEFGGTELRKLLPGVPLVESPFFDAILPTAGFDPETERVARDLHRDGFAVIRFQDEEFDQRAERIKEYLGRQFDAAACASRNGRGAMAGATSTIGRRTPTSGQSPPTNMS